MRPIKTTFCLTVLFFFFNAHAQMVTGVWHGKVNGQKAEIKIIKSGDSLTGTSYYYTSASNYRRYIIKGYFDEKTNQAVWWDDRLIEEKSGGIFGTPGKMPLLSRADYNCPGSGVMKLDGSSNEKNEEIKEGEVHLQKTSSSPVFTDEWDWVIDNFTVGTNDPYIIDSISLVAFHPKQEAPKEEPVVVLNKKPAMVFIPPVKEKAATPAPEPIAVAPPAKTIEQKFTVRSKKVFTTIPVAGDSIALSFYDNAIVDGDSISLFLDGRMLFTHIRLDTKPYTVKIAVADLKESSELTMVAENLGAIPPNTSYMVAMVGDKRYTANLASTEESSAVIRFKQ
jgi:hypothetical protein